jgi:hypothetical protein
MKAALMAAFSFRTGNVYVESIQAACDIGKFSARSDDSLTQMKHRIGVAVQTGMARPEREESP